MTTSDAPSANPAINEALAKARQAQVAAQPLATMTEKTKNDALLAIQDALLQNTNTILAANELDLQQAAENGVAPNMLDRLRLTEQRIEQMRDGLAQIIALPDPVGTVVGGRRRPNGLQITQIRVPLGVIGIIYESRPNVTVDAAALCLKSGNAAVLRGGSEAICSNIALAQTIRKALASVGAPENAVCLIENTDRAAVTALLTANGLVDCVIPRGGASLIETVVKHATVPTIETGTGNCHIYVDTDSDPEMASRIIINAKMQRPSVCNALETLLMHADCAHDSMTALLKKLQEMGVELRGCPMTVTAIPGVVPATRDDYAREFNDLILAVRVVDGVEEAIQHIAKYGTKHSEAIITTNYKTAQMFCDRVDAAAVYVNASTRFTDGFEFGLGAEIGISNQKLHARGPMGLEALTTTKYIVRGDGQIRE